METNPTRSQPSSLPLLILIGLLFYFFSNSPNSNQSQSRIELERRLEQRSNELNRLQDYLNNSNISSSTNNSQTIYQPNPNTFGNQTLPNAHQFIHQWYQQLLTRSDIDTQALYWKNISGHIKGNWRSRRETIDWWPPSLKSNISSTNPTESLQSQRANFPWTKDQNESTIQPSKWTYPSSQKIDFNLRESAPELVRANTSIVRGTMYISSGGSKDVILEVEGIHLQNQGKFYLRAYSNRIYLDTRIHLSSALDIPTEHLLNHSLPHPPSPQQTQIGQAIIADYIHRIDKIKKILKKGDLPRENEEKDGFEHDSANCTFLIYGGLTPLSTTTTQTAESLMEYERSLVEPTGASLTVPSPSHPIFQALMVSPNCGLVLESGEMPVLLGPSFWTKARNYGWVAGLVLGFQCWLLVWQMDSRQSPSSLSRMSYFSLVAQIIMDAWTFSSHLTLAVVTNNSSTETLLVPAFFACLNAILFGMRYGALIRIHESSPSADPATRTQTTPEDSHIGRDTDYVQVPATDLVDPSAPLVTNPPRPSRFRSLLNSVKILLTHRPFVSISIVAIFLLVVPFLLYSWQPLVLSILFSYWIPQIVHNVQHGTSRRGLRKRYVLGTTLCRLFLPLYIWGCPHNVLFITANPWIWMIGLYSLSQAMILILQDYLGARFFLLGFCFSYEPMWDYHPVKLPTNVDLEHGGGGALTGGGSGGPAGGEKMPECVICFEPIDVLPSSPTSSPESALDHPPHDHQNRCSSTEEPEPPRSRSSFPFTASSDVHHSLFSRWSYMVPPCHHIAHTKCLEGWLAIKSECPVCRRPLPPI